MVAMSKMVLGTTSVRTPVPQITGMQPPTRSSNALSTSAAMSQSAQPFFLGSAMSMLAYAVGSKVAGTRKKSTRTALHFFGSNVSPAPVPVFRAEEQFGASEPLGFFDPMGFSTYGDEAYFRNLREAELKHGRVAMLASIGFWAEHLARVPGFTGEPEGVMNAFDNLSKEQQALPFIFMLCGWLELGLFKQDPNKEVGNFGDPLKLGQRFPEFNNEDGRLKELNNGRMAMVALAVIFGTEWVTGVPSTQQLWFPF